MIYSLYILNGRIGQDKNIGKYTYTSTNGRSVIDYRICSSEIFPIISDFNIHVEERCESKPFPIFLNLLITFDKNPNPEQSMVPPANYKIPRTCKESFVEKIESVFTEE